MSLRVRAGTFVGREVGEEVAEFGVVAGAQGKRRPRLMKLAGDHAPQCARRACNQHHLAREVERNHQPSASSANG